MSLLTRQLSIGAGGISRYGRRTWLTWGLVRVAGLVVITGRVGYPQADNDVFRYFDWAVALRAGHLPWSSFPLEYPPGILPFLALPGSIFSFELEFIVLAFLADAAVLAMLRRGSPRGIGQWLWLAAPIALGTTFWLRLDLFVAAALVGFVVAIRSGRWKTAGACLAAACLLKLWPLVILAMAWRLIPSAGRRQVAGWCVGVVVAATLPVIAWGGGEGLLAMLRYQGDRGLEVESVAAYPFMLSWSLGHHVAPAFGHETMEFAVAGLVATVVSVALPLALVVLTGLIWRDNAARVTMTWAVSLIALVVLLTSKMMSPQYLIWILALTAVAVDEDRGLTTGARSRLVLTVTVTALLTQWIYPLHWVKVALAGGTEVMVVFTLRLAVLGLLTFLVARHTFARRADSDLLGADQAPAVESLGEYRGRLVVQQG